jgi:hypothetical protein
MTTLDQKAPAATEGSADLLDALVEDHLRGTPLRNAPPASLPEEMVSAVGDAPPSPAAKGATTGDDEQNAELLQREIDTLLRGDGTSTDLPEAAAEAGPEAALMEPAATLDELQNEADLASEGVTDAELQTLLPADETEGHSVQPLVEPPVEALQSAGGDEETARQLSEAEGVLAAELAQLMADVSMGGKGPVQVNGVEPGASAGAESAPVEASEPLPESTAAVAAVGAESPPAVVEAATALPPPVVVELPEAGEDEAPPRPGFFARLREIASGVVLLIAQLIDMPFARIGEIDKNIVGVAALLLLLGGCVMYGLSLYFQ